MSECESKNTASAIQTCKDQVNAYVAALESCDGLSGDALTKCEGTAEYTAGTSVCEGSTSCDSGSTYNCQVGSCITDESNEELLSYYLDCYMMDDESEKAACQDNLNSVASTGSTLQSDLEGDASDFASNAKGGAMSAGVGVAGGLISTILAISNSGPVCASSAILTIGSVYALYNELTHSKEVK